MASCTLKHAVSSKIDDLSAEHLKYDFGGREKERKKKEKKVVEQDVSALNKLHLNIFRL